MKGRAIYLDTLKDGRRAAALMVDGQLEDLLVDAPDDGRAALPGAIFRARPDRAMKGMGGMMVRLGNGETGFLKDARSVSRGQPLLVQVGAVGEAGKAPPVSRKLLFKSRYAIVTPGNPGVNVSRAIRDDDTRDELLATAHDVIAEVQPDGSLGLILRSAAETAPVAEIAEDIADMLALAREVLGDDGQEPELLLEAPDAHLQAWRDWATPVPDLVDGGADAFENGGVWDALRSALSPQVPLPGGAHMMIEPTRALVAVDVNTGSDTSLAAGLKANVAALRRLPGLLRLKGLAGQITADLAPFPKKERTQLEQVARAAIRKDAGEMLVAGWTPLGHLEFQRKRDRLPLSESLKDVLPDL